MPVAAPRPISLTAAERHQLKKTAHGHKTAYQDRIRAQIVLHAARGRGNARIARDTGVQRYARSRPDRRLSPTGPCGPCGYVAG